MVYSDCHCSSAVGLSLNLMFPLFKINRLAFAGKVLSSWLSACAVSYRLPS